MAQVLLVIRNGRTGFLVRPEDGAHDWLPVESTPEFRPAIDARLDEQDRQSREGSTMIRLLALVVLLGIAACGGCGYLVESKEPGSIEEFFGMKKNTFRIR